MGLIDAARRTSPKRLVVSGLIFVCAVMFAVFIAVASSRPGGSTEAPSWVHSDFSKWPQIVLTNRATFRGSSDLDGASAFLIQSPDSRVLAATAKHLIGPNGGVEPRIPLSGLNNAIISWVLAPRTHPQRKVELGSLAISDTDERSHDWLLLTVKNSTNLPAQPVKVREKPVSTGETVFLVGVAYADQDVSQNVYRGKVTERRGDKFRYTIDPPVDIRGFSGAPILDSDGMAVGVMTVWFEPKMQGEKYLEAGGEDIATALHLMRSPEPAR